MGKEPLTSNENQDDFIGQTGKGKSTLNLSNDAPFHDFNSEPVFEGRYTGREISDKEGKTIGYMFVTEEDEEVTIGNSYRITEALSKCEELGIKNPELRIEFLGKMKKKKDGQEFNRFKIDLLKD